MDQLILSKIKMLKTKYESDGFIVLGLFGSYARGKETPDSDIDILVELNHTFIYKYIGWEAYSKMEEIKNEFVHETGKKIDFADKNAMNRVGKKYILNEVIYV